MNIKLYLLYSVERTGKEGKGRKRKGRERKGKEGKERERKGKEGKGRERMPKQSYRERRKYPKFSLVEETGPQS